MRNREALPEVWEGSRGPCGGLGGLPEGLGGVSRPYWRSGRGVEALPKVWEALPDVWEGLGGPPGGPEGLSRSSRRFKRPSRRFGRDPEALPEV